MEIDQVFAFEVATLSRQRNLEEATKSGNSEIQRFYAGTSIFITGGTGFLGKQLIEKLLRSCPKINKIYALARPKKGKSVQERLEEMTADPLYQQLYTTNPDFTEKIILMEGDITELELGMSEKDKQIVTDKVNVIFHVAATVRFDEPLRNAVKTNIQGTREVLQLASKCKQLKCFLHVSTAFSNCIHPTIEEKFYPTPVSYELVIDLIDAMNEERLDRITPELIKPWPNTYAFTKAIAEETVKNFSKILPVAVLRPAIVGATYQEPAPGWVDTSSVYGPSAVVLGSGMGIMHSFLADHRLRLDLVPADFVNNACIAAAWRTSIEFDAGNREPKMYNYVSGHRNSLTWGRIVEICNDARWMVSPRAVWYCFNVVQPNWFLHIFLTFLFHVIPAYIVDGIANLVGKEPKLRKLYSKMYKLNQLLSYFTLREWQFSDENVQDLYKSLSPTDRQIFQFNITNLDWIEYVQLWYLGLRKYIVKDDLKDTKVGVKKQFWFKIGHYIVVMLYVFLFWKLFAIIFSGLRWIFNI